MNPVTKAADVTMAQAGGAQREPSMEEILASIRRIIEDNDTGRDVGRKVPGGAPVPADPVDFEVERVASATESAVVEVDAFRAELRTPAEAKPMTLAEVQAQVAETAPVDVFSELRPGNDIGVAQGEPEMSFEDEQIVQAVEALAEPDEPVEEPVRAEVAHPRTAILSERTGRQVAAAFGELSEAFAARSKKTFDEMAEEMLRPMLQDWLDNNLPTLVERLVREEIERVARGAQ